jgi:hypothetical protein
MYLWFNNYDVEFRPNGGDCSLSDLTTTLMSSLDPAVVVIVSTSACSSLVTIEDGEHTPCTASAHTSTYVLCMSAVPGFSFADDSNKQ